MKEYVVYADVTMSVHAVVTANSEEEAEEIALQKINDNAFDYARKADACVDVEVVDVVKNS